jgi:ribosome recycling factor
MLYDEAKYKSGLENVITRFKEEISTLRTGGANQEMFDNIMVDAYGSNMPVSNLASLVFEGRMSISVKVFDKNNSPNVVKALSESLQGASVTDQGEVIRVNFRPITQEDRDVIVKELKRMLESARVAARLVRQDFMQKVKAMEGVSEDEQKLAEKDIQETLEEYIKKLESISTDKEIELSPNK